MKRREFIAATAALLVSPRRSWAQGKRRFQWNGSSSVAFRAAAEMAGLPLAVSLLEFGTSEADIRAAVESISRDGANAVMVLDSPQVLQNSTLIAKLLGDAKLPAIFAFTESVEAGGLMAYSFDLIELHKRAALDIDAILRGAKTRQHPDLPSNQIRVVHQPQHSQAAGAFRTSCAHRECRQGN